MTAKLGQHSVFSRMECQVWMEKMGHMGNVTVMSNFPCVLD